ncbi:hypothetical protein RN001_012722 [Aquatica leii]|uniref:Uncharacterized protein n=1 Tax=Aquatica leii TaxID=1421715 RepID=A0AAN7SPL8_9COLE|nr:hypothetical protein RN001_012722 [Aquatica leii]
MFKQKEGNIKQAKNMLKPGPSGTSKSNKENTGKTNKKRLESEVEVQLDSEFEMEDMDSSEETDLDNHHDLNKYNNVCDDTEEILKKLQNHIEQEEMHWRNELKTKELETEPLKQRQLSRVAT